MVGLGHTHTSVHPAEALYENAACLSEVLGDQIRPFKSQGIVFGILSPNQTFPLPSHITVSSVRSSLRFMSNLSRYLVMVGVADHQ